MLKQTDPSEIHAIDLETYRSQALVLLKHQKTFTLAVAENDQPWVAPVFYVYVAPGIYFFSSPRSKHIQALSSYRLSAGAIYADGDQLQDIQGLQMVGHVAQVQSKLEHLKITACYLAKFPLARGLLASRTPGSGDYGLEVGLYVFHPMEIHCTNNRLGFGRRVQIQL